MQQHTKKYFKSTSKELKSVFYHKQITQTDVIVKERN